MRKLWWLLAIALVVGCSWWSKPAVKPVVPAAPTPIVTPDLQPGSTELLARMRDLWVQMTTAKDQFAGAFGKLVEMAAKHDADVLAQKQAVTNALKQYDALAAQYLACQKESNQLIADLQAKIDALSAEAASARKAEIVVNIIAMAFIIALILVLWLYPIPWPGLTWLKMPAIFVLAGMGIALLAGMIFAAYARTFIWIGVSALILGVIGLVAYAILSGKYKDWLQKLGLGIQASPSAISIASKLQGSTPGLGDLLDEVGAKVPLPGSGSTPVDSSKG